MASSGGPPERYFGAWAHQTTNAGFDVEGGPWNGCAEIPVLSFCRGDGSATPCPCGNTGASGHGCGNSTFAGGAELSATGNASIANDSFTLSVFGTVPGKPGLFFQGDNAVDGGSGVAFGDGLRCAGGEVVRLQVRVADASGQAETSIGISDAAGLSAGELKRYQWWYRDPAGSPCGTTFNLSNGIEVLWMP
jgi:hypothetical protein